MYPQCPFERYADDMVVHCKTLKEAENVQEEICKRLEDCKLELNMEKTKLVYCKDKDRINTFPNIVDFLGYTFKAIVIKDRTGRVQMNFLASASKKSNKDFRLKIKQMEIHKRTGSKIDMIAEQLNPIIRRWMNYYGKYNKSAMKPTLNCIQRRLVKWVMCKYKRFRGYRRRAENWLREVQLREPSMFAHWTLNVG